MNVAILSDIHGNRYALEAVLGKLSGQASRIVCLGDVVGYGGDPSWCVDVAAASGWFVLAGNHDRAVTVPGMGDWFNPDAMASIRWTQSQMTTSQFEWLRDLPESQTISQALMVHASPRDPIFEYISNSRVAEANLSVIGNRLCFHGHTHIPGAFSLLNGSVRHSFGLGSIRLEGPMLINPGSVGQPRDGDPDACYGIWDPDTGEFEFKRVAYDREAAKQAILAAGLPARFASRLDIGR